MAIEETVEISEIPASRLEKVILGFEEMAESDDPKERREGLQGLAGLFIRGLVDPNDTGETMQFSPPFTPEFLAMTFKKLYDLFAEGGEIHDRAGSGAKIRPEQETIFSEQSPRERLSTVAPAEMPGDDPIYEPRI